MYWDFVTENAIGTLTIDRNDKDVNTLGEDVMEELEENINILENQDLKGLIINSGKDNNFIAGADIEELQTIDNEKQAYDGSRQGQKLFQRIANLPYPTIAAVHGACLGGGFELSLACDYRVVSDHNKTELGCPEVKLGILPGWGGTQRMPRLMGVKDAIGKLLKGSSMGPNEAKSLGAADAVVDKSILERKARKMIENQSFPSQSSPTWQNLAPVRWYILRESHKRTMSNTKGNMPAPIKIIEAVKQGMSTSLEEGLKIEAEKFGELAVTPECKNLIRVFFLHQSQENFSLDSSEKVDSPERIGVIGAGTMGSGITHWVSSRDLDCAMIDINGEIVNEGMKKIQSLFQKGVKAGALDEQKKRRSLRRIHAGTDYETLRGSDLVIEAVVEKMDIKQTVLEQLDDTLDDDAVIASNTSALSLEEMAQFLENPSQMVGLHFFNPVYKMPLVEVVEADSTSEDTLVKAVEFTKQIGKIPVVVKDSPGFLVNRILGPYMNEAGELLDEGYAIEDIDEALEQFGMPMGPVRLLDEVGIDVAYEVAEYLTSTLDVAYEPADSFRQIHEDGLTGKKGGEGFYVYDGDDEPNPTYNPDDPVKNPDYKDLARRMIDLIIAESARCLQENIVADPDHLDIAMILGTGFAPFTGGPLNHADNYGLRQVVSELETFQEIHGDRFQVPELLRTKADAGETFTSD